MAAPRIFVSSTYYDLKTVRSDIERFIETMGYEPVLNEKGHIPYGNKNKLEEYCYKEVGACDIIVSIIGGRYGSSSAREDASISQMELKTAIDLGRQVYVFVDKSVKSEHKSPPLITPLLASMLRMILSFCLGNNGLDYLSHFFKTTRKNLKNE